jgi:hypothetical protein
MFNLLDERALRAVPETLWSKNADAGSDEYRRFYFSENLAGFGILQTCLAVPGQRTAFMRYFIPKEW